MKICEYCETNNPDDAPRCASCGGASFRHICENCGTEYKEGVFCPCCGVKVGQKPHICPRCKTTYYSNACPNCGYFPEQKNNETPAAQEKGKRTALWVLGWIFFFPVPLSILIVRSDKLAQWAKVVLVIFVWLLFLLFAFFGKQSETAAQNGTLVVPDARVCYVEGLQFPSQYEG